MIRDKRKDSVYFENYITVQEERINKFLSIIDSLSDINKIERCYSTILTLQKDLFSASYSAGASKNELIDIFSDYLKTVKKVKDITYNECIDIVAIAIMFDVDLGVIKQHIKDTCELDDLIYVLLGEKEKITGKLLYKDYFECFYNFINGEVAPDEFLQYIENEWYLSCKDIYWYDSLKNKNDTYFGYWCWLASACLKVKGILLDEEFIYIPKI